MCKLEVKPCTSKIQIMYRLLSVLECRGQFFPIINSFWQCIELTDWHSHTHIFIFILTADITAEELFNMFFGGGFHNQNVYTRRGGRWQRAENHSQNREVCFLNACASKTEMGVQFWNTDMFSQLWLIHSCHWLESVATAKLF